MTTDEIQRCEECGMHGLSSIEIKSKGEVLVCSACLSCGRTSWSHDGSDSSADDVMSTVVRFWQIPTPRRPRSDSKRRRVLAMAGSAA
jgi:hypothetical protein